jgi:O-antigen/teichoic acid export membrane protein
MSEAPAVPIAPSADAQPAAKGSDARGIVIRNTLFLTIAQIISIPLSLTANAVIARYLGAAAIGYLYIGSTFNSCGNIVVEWGQSGSLPQLVAQHRERAGEFLGTSLLWRCTSSLVVLGALLLLARVLGYDRNVEIVIALVALCYLLTSISSACQAVVVGFERTDVSAYRQIIEQFAALGITVPIVVLGGGLYAMVLGSAASILVALVYAWRSLRLVKVTRLSVNVESLRALLLHSTPFALTVVVGVLQPYLDAVFLSKLASADVVGWHAAARKLIGVLIFPASALIGALYPTLCRLHSTDYDEFVSSANGALRGTSLLVLPVALGCLLYPDIGIAIYSHAAFGPAEQNLRVMSAFLFLVYFTMPLSIAILAAGKQRVWALVQALCVVVSVVADPLLIPRFQKSMGNGGVGVCVATVFSEVLVLVCAVWLVPRGMFDRRFLRTSGSAVLGGLAMAGVAYALRSINSFVAAPVAVIAYAAAVWFSGGVDEGFVSTIRSMMMPKLARLRRAFG